MTGKEADNKPNSTIEDIRKSFVIKTVKGKKYYYLKTKVKLQTPHYTGIKSLPIYVCPVTCTDEELIQQKELVQARMALKILQFSHELSEKHYKSQYLTENEKKKLIFLHFAYNVHLNQYSETDVERYEEAAYTKYVYGTTSIEGNTYTLRETDLTLNEGITIAGKDKREFYEIENYGRLKRFLDSKKKIEVNLQLIRKLHSIIMQNIDDDGAGHFRRVDVGIRGSEFEPAPAAAVEYEMKELIHWYGIHKNKIHPIELAAVFHQRFEEIHPFKDGNGRVGREVVRIILEQHSYPTIFIDKTSREEYLKALDQGNSGNHKPICSFLVKNLIEMHNGLVQKAKENLKKDVQNKDELEIDAKTKKILRKFIDGII